MAAQIGAEMAAPIGAHFWRVSAPKLANISALIGAKMHPPSPSVAPVL
jgi:hypothetical protein